MYLAVIVVAFGIFIYLIDKKERQYDKKQKKKQDEKPTLKLYDPDGLKLFYQFDCTITCCVIKLQRKQEMKNKIKLRVDPNEIFHLVLETKNYRIPLNYESKRKDSMVKIANDLCEDLNATFEEDLSEPHWK